MEALPTPFGFPAMVGCQPYSDLQSQDSLLCVGPAIIARRTDAQVFLSNLIIVSFHLFLLILKKPQRLKPRCTVFVVRSNDVCRQACHDTRF